MRLTVYLAGEIHTSWREEVKQQAKDLQLPIDFVGPMEDHDRSDNIGEEILGEQPDKIFKDVAASSLNNLRTEQYKQWNTAMDASAAVAFGKPLILIRQEAHHHPLKELSRKAHVTVESVDQAVSALKYIFD